MQEKMIAGVGVGGLTDIRDIKILICYLIESVKSPLTNSQIHDIFSDGQYVNYFSFCEALADLEKYGNISVSNDVYHLTDLGKTTSSTYKSTIPSSLRDNVVTSAMKLLAKVKREKDITYDISPVTDGFSVKCSVNDGDFTLLKFEIYAPDMYQAELIVNKFKSDPTKLYINTMNTLLS